MGIVARLSAQKAHEVLFEAVAKCAESVPRVRLVVIGGGDRESELRELARKLNIDTRTIISRYPSRRTGSAARPGRRMSFVGPRRCADHADRGDGGRIADRGDRLRFGSRHRGRRSSRVLSSLSVMSRNSPIGFEYLRMTRPLRARFGKSGRARVESEFRIQNTARKYEELLTDVLARKG